MPHSTPSALDSWAGGSSPRNRRLAERHPFARDGLLIARCLSLDVVLGVLCAALFATSITAVSPPIVWWIALPTATWSIYAADRLLDARRTGASAHSIRHRFHHRHAGRLVPQTLLVIVTTVAASALFLPVELLIPGTLIALAVTAHLFLAQRPARKTLPKELSAALIYVAGIWFAPLSLSGAFESWTLVFVLLHFLSVLLNLLLFSLIERRIDLLDDHGSIARSWGTRSTRSIIRLLTVAGIALAALAGLAPPERLPAVAVLTILVVLPELLLRHVRYFARNDRYRVYGDSAFLLLSLPWILSHVV